MIHSHRWILLFIVLSVGKIDATQKIEGLITKRSPISSKILKIYYEDCIQEAKHQIIWPDLETETTLCMKEIIKTGNYLDFNNPHIFYENHLKYNLSPYKISPCFPSLSAYKDKSFDSAQEYLVIKRRGTFASVYFQTNGIRVPLGYPHTSDANILDLISAYYDFNGKKTPLPNTEKGISAFLLKRSSTFSLYSQSFYLFSKFTEKAPEVKLGEINFLLNEWYKFKNLQIKQLYLDNLAESYMAAEQDKIELLNDLEDKLLEDSTSLTKENYYREPWRKSFHKFKYLQNKRIEVEGEIDLKQNHIKEVNILQNLLFKQVQYVRVWWNTFLNS